MRKLSAWFVLVSAFFLVSFSSFAEDDITVNLSVTCPERIESLYKPISQRVLLAMLGVEGSINALSYTDLSPEQLSIIRGMTKSERSACAAPMPIATANTVYSILYYLYLITAVIWAVMLAVYAYDSSYLSQNRNTEKDNSDESPVMKIIRSVLACAVTIPMFDFAVYAFTDKSLDDGDMSAGYSPVHNLMFKAIGQAVGVAEEIDASLKKTYQSESPIYSIPEPAYAVSDLSTGFFQNENAMSGILDFGLCVTLDHDGGEVDFAKIQEEVIRDNNYYILRFKYDEGDSECQADLKMKKDLVTESIVAQLRNSGNFDSAFDYANAEASTFTNLARNLLDVSVGYAEGLISNFDTISQRFIPLGDSISENLRSNNVNAELKELSNWVRACPFTKVEAKDFAKKFSLPDGDSRPSLKTVSAMRTISEQCASYLVVSKLSYPKRFDDDFVSTPNEEFGRAELKFDAAIVGEKTADGVVEYLYPEARAARRLPDRQYQACSFGLNSSFADEADCLKAVCENVEPTEPVSGLFECALMINTKSNSSLNKFYDSLGFLATPATLLTRLESNGVPSSPQELLTSFHTEYEGEVSRKLTYYDLYRDFADVDIEHSIRVYNGFDHSYKSLKFADTDNKTPIDDIFQCLINPSQVIKNKDLLGNTYDRVCDHPIGEIHNFGMYVLKIYAGFMAGVATKHSQGFLLDKYASLRKSMNGTDGAISGTGAKVSSSLDKITSNTKKEASKVNGKSNILIDKLKAFFVTAGSAALAGSIFGLVLDGDGPRIPHFLSAIVGVTSEEMPYWSDPRGSFSTASAIGGFALGYMVSGNVILEVDKKLSKSKQQQIKNLHSNASQKNSSKTTALGLTLLSIGIVAAFIVPLVPAAIFYAAFVAVLANMIAMIFSANFHVVYAIANTGRDVRQKLTKLMNKWILLILRLPLLVVGFYLAYSMMATVLPSFATVTNELITYIGLETRLFGVIDVSGVISLIIAYALFLFFFILLMFATFDAITGPFELTRGLVFNDNSGEALGKVDSLQKLDQNVKLFKNL